MVRFQATHCNAENNSSIANGPTNYALYQNIQKSYERNIKNADFDTLIDEVDRYMSAGLCMALRDADSYKQSLYKTKIVIPHLSQTIDRILGNVTKVADNAIRRYKFFTENWSEMVQDLATVPISLHPYLLPLITNNAAQSAMSFTQLITREVEKIQGAVLVGSMAVSKLYI